MMSDAFMAYVVAGADPGGARGAGAPPFQNFFVQVIFTLYNMKISLRDVK